MQTPILVYEHEGHQRYLVSSYFGVQEHIIRSYKANVDIMELVYRSLPMKKIRLIPHLQRFQSMLANIVSCARFCEMLNIHLHDVGASARHWHP